MSEIKPALTPEEWRKKATGDGDTGDTMILDGFVAVVMDFTRFIEVLDRHGTAALCLHGQPFGFTREDVLLCRGQLHHPESAEIWELLHSLADRIEALLPPK